MPSFVLRRVRALPLTLFVLAACGDDGGPRFADDLPASASVMRARAAQIAEVSGQPPLLALTSGFFVMPLSPTALRAPAGVRGALDAGRPRRQIGGFFPAGVLGKTFVRDPMNGWAVDTLANGTPRPGAPPTGVRFMLQETDMFGIASGPPVGMLDVTPRVGGSASMIGYHVIARTLTGTPVLQYDSNMSPMSESATLVGRAMKDTRTIEMAESGSLRTMETSTTAAFAGVSRTATMEYDFMSETPSLSATTIVKLDGGTVRIVTESNEQDGSIRIFSNGGLFARIDMGPSDGPFVGDEPVWMRGDGRTPLDAEDQDALFAMYEMTNTLPSLFIMDINVQQWLFEISVVGMP